MPRALGGLRVRDFAYAVALLAAVSLSRVAFAAVAASPRGDARLLASSAAGDPETATIALAAGACGILPPQRDRTLVEVFFRAVAGELVLPAEDLPQLVDRVRTGHVGPSGPERLAALTRREQQILAALTEGRATAELAVDLGISPLTVQSHVKNILSKLGVHTKVDAVRLVWRHGLGSTSRSA